MAFDDKNDKNDDDDDYDDYDDDGDNFYHEDDSFLKIHTC